MHYILTTTAFLAVLGFAFFSQQNPEIISQPAGLPTAAQLDNIYYVPACGSLGTVVDGQPYCLVTTRATDGTSCTGYDIGRHTYCPQIQANGRHTGWTKK